MIKKVSCLLLFVVIFIVGDRLLALLLGKIVIKSGTKFATVYRGNNNFDVVILGNSHGDNSFYPPDIEEATGLKVFQLSHKGMSTEISSVLWRDYLRLNAAPKVLLLEMTGLFEDNKALADIKSYSYWSKDMECLFKKDNEIAYRTARFFNLLYWNGEIVIRSLYFLGKTDQHKVEYNKRIVKKAYADHLVAEERLKGGQLCPIRENNLSSLQDIVESANERRCEVFILFCPWYPDYAGLASSDIENCIARIKSSIGDKAVIMNYASSIADGSAFEDLTHLNYHGSRLLLKNLVADGVLKRARATSLSSW